MKLNWNQSRLFIAGDYTEVTKLKMVTSPCSYETWLKKKFES